MVKNLPANEGDAKDAGSVPGSERSPGEENGNPLQYSCLENPMDRGVWWATVHGLQRIGNDLSTEYTGTHQIKHSPSQAFVFQRTLVAL